MTASDISRILIVAQTFPPDGGIGGRRWAKFAKYLVRRGFFVEVVAADLDSDEESLWTEDVSGIPVHRYSHRFPKALGKRPATAWDKMAYRVALLRMKSKAEGTPYDRALLDRDAFTDLFRERMKKFHPEVVIATGAPFNLLHYIAELRSEYPETRFIADFRDPWIGGEPYGYSNLAPHAEEIERRKEAVVAKGFDAITTPWPVLRSELEMRYPASPGKFKFLSHCWDREEVARVPQSDAFEADMMYGGNLYQGFLQFFSFLSTYAKKNSADIVIYSSDDRLDSLAHKYFRVKEPVKSKDFFKRLSRSRFLLFLIPENLKDGFPTKLLEFAATGRPLIAVGSEGQLSRTITERGLGVFMRPEETDKLGEILSGKEHHDPDRAWIDRHGCEEITGELIKIIQETRADGREK